VLSEKKILSEKTSCVIFYNFLYIEEQDNCVLAEHLDSFPVFSVVRAVLSVNSFMCTDFIDHCFVALSLFF
jgi:hypothetical protein